VVTIEKQLSPMPKRSTPHPARLTQCMERGHDPYPGLTLVVRSFSDLRLLWCSRCGLGYVEHKNAHKSQQEGGEE
jgi:hypothetical protein